jgi:hypothetical protein
MNFSDWIGAIGVSLLLLAYLLNLYKVLAQNHLIYILLNLLGASLAAYASILIGFIPFVILEGTWAGVSLVALLRYFTQKSDNQTLSFELLPQYYALCRLAAQSPIPEWLFQSPFYTLSKSENELSLLCQASLVPTDIQAEKGWRLLRINAVLDLSLTGITARFSKPLAEKGINICVIATYDTDYVLIKAEKLALATEALQKAGFLVDFKKSIDDGR